MNVKYLARKVFKGFYWVTEVSAWFGYVALAAIILIIFVDVGGRYFLNSPLPGSNELVEIVMIVLGGFAIMYTAVKRGHIAIDLLVARFPRRTQIIMERITSLLGFGTWGLLAYEAYVTAQEALKRSDITAILSIRTGPFLLTLAVALFLCCLTLLMQTSHPEVPLEKPEERKEPCDEP